MGEHPVIGRTVVYVDASGEWRWTAYAMNERAIAVGSEGYTNRQDCIDAVSALFPAATLDVVEPSPSSV